LFEGLAALAALAEDVLDAPHLLGGGEPFLEAIDSMRFKGSQAVRSTCSTSDRAASCRSARLS
jgi:hypothetical protein